MGEQRREFMEAFLRLSMKFLELMKHQKNFGTERLLYASEIHVLELIGNYPGITVTELADRLGISKSALPKVIHKLIQKDLIYRYQENGNKKNILLDLTDGGRIAFQQHSKFHETVDAGVMKKINALTPEEYLSLIDIFQELEQFIDCVGQQE